MKRRKGFLIGMTALVCAGAFSGCRTAQETSADIENVVQQGQQELTYTPGMYDSEDTAMIIAKDTENSTVQLQNLSTGKRYTLSYDGTTKLFDKYEQAVALSQIEQGSIVTARFYKENKKLASLGVTQDSIHYDNVERYLLDTAKSTLTVADTTYNLSSHLVVLSQGEEADLMDINQVDVLSVWGWRNQIYGITIEKGHGYLRLKNETNFVGGWLEVGQSIIRKVTEDMLITVPEGTENVTISYRGNSAAQQITFDRNQEMAWDLGDVEIKQVQNGQIIFTITPAEAAATVTIDGKNVDTTSPVTLTYGLHQMTVTAQGYDTVAQYIKVAEPSANIAVTMELSDKTTEETAQTDTTTAQETTTETDTQTDTPATTTTSPVTGTTQSGYQVHIDAPQGAEVYLDGNYIGIVPINFAKTAGNYVVTLRKSGYQTRSYTLQIDSEEKDVTYSFSELIELSY